MRSGATLAALLLTAGSLCHQTAYAANLPDFQEVRAAHRSAYAELLDRHEKVLQMLQLDRTEQRLPWVALNDLSPAMQQALLVSEDRRFFQHHGVDWRAFVGAAWENLRYDTHRGASTLTMQLAGLLDQALARNRGGRTYAQKWQQIKAADALEKHWTKAQILDAYLNLVTFRSDLSGINAASHALFDVAPARIDSAQAAILAALLRGPNAQPAVVAARACGVAQLLKPPRPNCATINALAYSKLDSHPRVPLGDALAPELGEQYLSVPGERLSTSIDIAIQQLALHTLQKQIKLSPIDSGAILVVKNSTAEILAYANAHGSGNTAIDDQVIAVHSADTLTQAFLYELAIEQRLITAATVLNDTPAPITVSTLFPGYINDASIPAWVSTRYALASALNAPAAQVQGLISAPDFDNRLQLLGLSAAETAPGQPTETSLLNLTNAYQTLANRGVYRMVSLRTGGLNTNQTLLSADASAIIENILADRSAHGDTGLTVDGYAAYTLAEDDKQQWCIGSTGMATVAVWIGDSGRNTANGAGNRAAKVWKTVVSALNRGLLPGTTPKLPDTLVVQDIRYQPPVEPPRQELFMPGTELEQTAPLPADAPIFPALTQ